MVKKKLTQLKQLQKEIPDLIKKYGDDTALARAAMINPILALENIGYELSDELKHELDYHIRFGPEKKKRLLKLEKDIYIDVGKSFDLQDEKQVRKNIHPFISIKENAVLAKPSARIRLSSNQGVSQLKSASLQKTATSPYAGFSKTHKVIPKLIEYQDYELNAPKLGSKKLFNKALKDKKIGGIKINSVRFRLSERLKEE
ncbi:MAG: hypothetical protein ACJAQ4_000722 [Cryomorphaceae bacterium]|jgi:hypothetical protein